MTVESVMTIIETSSMLFDHLFESVLIVVSSFVFFDRASSRMLTLLEPAQVDLYDERAINTGSEREYRWRRGDVRGNDSSQSLLCRVHAHRRRRGIVHRALRTSMCVNPYQLLDGN